MPEPARLPLFDDVEDQASIQPKQMKDDVEFRKQRRRSRKKSGRLSPPPASGPCCHRCVNWHQPRYEDEEYGECRTLFVATDRKPSHGIEKGEVHDRIKLRDAGIAGEPLHTGPAFSCFVFQPRKDNAA